MPLPFRDLLCGPNGTPVEIYQAPLRRRMRKDHAAAPPIPGGMGPGARWRIAHTALLRQGRGIPRCCRYTSPRLPGTAAWNVASYVPGRARRDLAVLSGLSLACVLLRLCVSPVTVGIARPPRSCPTPVRTPPDRCQRWHAASPAEPR